MPYIQNTLSFTIEMIFGLYLIAAVLRFLFQLCRVDFRNPISQMIVTLTNPPLKFLRKLIPGLYGIDMASVILILVIGMIKIILLLSISGYPVNLSGVAVLTVSEALNIIIWIFILCILVNAILSWVAPGTYHPVLRMISDVSDPVLRPFRRMIPVLSGIDLSPLFALLALNIALRLLVAPLTDLGQRLIF